MSPNITLLAHRLIAWFEQNARDLPWRRTMDPYAIWISEIMLQQTQVKTVVPYWERWMSRFPNVQTLANASLDDVLKLWEGLGYYSRARHIHSAANLIRKDHNGEFPNRFTDLHELPGIGRYTAGAICSIAFDEPTPILDGNVTRVLSRVFGIKQQVRSAPTQAQLWKLAEKLVCASKTVDPAPTRPCSNLNQSLMELGATICSPKQPVCSSCPVNSNCYALRYQLVARLPNLGVRVNATKRRFVAIAVNHRGRWLVRQRPANVVNAHLWEFPNCEVTDDNKSPLNALAASCLGFDAAKLQPLCTIKHTITRYRIQLDVYTAELNGAPAPKIADATWRRFTELDQLAFPSAHRRIVDRLSQGKKLRVHVSPATKSLAHS